MLLDLPRRSYQRISKDDLLHIAVELTLSHGSIQICLAMRVYCPDNKARMEMNIVVVVRLLMYPTWVDDCDI